MYFALHSRKNSRIVTKHKFVCPMHGEAKQTETSEFGADRGVYCRTLKGDRWLLSKKPTTFSKAFLKAR